MTGIQGSGKTHFGEYLASMCTAILRTPLNSRFVDNPLTYLFKLSAEGKKPVFTSGFVPVFCQIELVRSIGKRGFWDRLVRRLSA